MANMSYCRFQNTLDALQDCQDALYEQHDVLDNDEFIDDGEELSDEEKTAKKALIELCNEIAKEFGDIEI